MSKTTRSTWKIDAVAEAAARTEAEVLRPERRLAVMAGLAGFVLRWFRRSVMNKAAARQAHRESGSGVELKRSPSGAGAESKRSRSEAHAKRRAAAPRDLRRQKGEPGHG